MVGSGCNVKSMAYVENVAAFLSHARGLGAGVHCYNYVDKPDLSMNELVALAKAELGLSERTIRLPYSVGLLLGYGVDLLATVTKKSFPVSAIRIRKFCATTRFSTSIEKAGFVAPVKLLEGLRRTIRYEFLEPDNKKKVFLSE